jgi:hypothetical protein
VRLGVLGNLSEISSAYANSVNTITAGSDPSHANGDCSFSQPKCAAHDVFAGAVNDRNPPNTTIKNAKMCSAHSGSNLTRKPLFVNPDSILCSLQLPQASNGSAHSASNAGSERARIVPPRNSRLLNKIIAIARSGRDS